MAHGILYLRDDPKLSNFCQALPPLDGKHVHSFSYVWKWIQYMKGQWMKVGDKRMTESSNIICLHVVLTPGFPSGSTGKESALSVRDLGLIPGLGRSPGEGKGYPLQYSDLENSTHCIVHGVANSQRRLSDFHFILTPVVEAWCMFPFYLFWSIRYLVRFLIILKYGCLVRLSFFVQSCAYTNTFCK